MAVSVVVGAKVVGGDDPSVAMWALASDAAPGDRIQRDDLVATRVHFSDAADAGRYFRVDEALPSDVHLVRGLGAGELVPRTGLGPAPGDVVHVSVAVAPTALPPGLRPGAVVDLWAAPRGGSERDEAVAVRLVTDVVVLDVPGAGGDLGPGVGDSQVVLAVPDRRRQLARVLAASSAGDLLVVGRA